MELNVIQKTRELCEYVLTVTHKSPKEFRFTLTEKLHGYVLSAMENLLRANETRNDGGEGTARRRQYQTEALTDFKLLGYMSDLARKQKCILFSQYEQISQKLYECRNLLFAWMKSDGRRRDDKQADFAADETEEAAESAKPDNVKSENGKPDNGRD